MKRPPKILRESASSRMQAELHRLREELAWAREELDAARAASPIPPPSSAESPVPAAPAPAPPPQDQFDLITAGTLNLLAQCTADQRYVQVNRSYAEYFSRTPETFPGRHLREILSPEGYEFIRPHVDRVLQGQAASFDLELEHPGRGWCFLNAVFTPERSPEGPVTGWIMSFTDITEQISTSLENRSLNAALQESEARFRNMCDAAPVMIWMTDSGGLCNYVNQTWLLYRGTRYEEEMGDGWLGRIHPADRRRWQDLFQSAFAARREFKLEYRIQRHDGEYYWVLEQGGPRFTPNRDFTGYIGTCVDISERKYAEQILVQSHEELEKRVRQRTVEMVQANEMLQAEILEHKKHKLALARLADIVESSSDAIFSVTRDRKVLSWNRGAERLTGFSSPEMVRSSLAPLLPPDQAAVFDQCFAEVLNGAAIPTFDTALLAKDGLRLEVALTLSPLRSVLGRIVGLSFIARNISERKHAEAALRESRERYFSLFLKAQAAERNQRRLSSQVLSAQETERKRISRELHDEVGQALTAISIRLAALKKSRGASTAFNAALHDVQHLLETTMEAVHGFASALRPSMLDELGLVPALRSSLKSFTKRTGLKVRFNATPRAEQLGAEEKLVLYRVLQESLTNVTRHARASQVMIDLQEAGNAIVMTVADNGRSFQPDVSGASGRRRLGLLGMQERVRLVNGQFEIRPQPGIGTTVRVAIGLKSLPPLAKSAKLRSVRKTEPQP
ncbi:MAG TPA: PAS domain S-box protein [Dongiaceae bacterium]|nr:PAS domain S-box protein [Dongiaceae bacterium]